MKNRVLHIIALIACVAFYSCEKKETVAIPGLAVGVSIASINPEIGAFIAGDKQNRKFTGVHDSLYARAVVITGGMETISLVTIDCIGLLYTDVLRIRDRASELCGIDPERIVISSTHTHSGPDVVGIWGSDYTSSGVDSSYMKRLTEITALQIKKAFDSQVPATAITGKGVFGDPWVQNISDKEIDRSVTALQFLDTKGEVITTLTNFACHPTILDAVFSEVSSDFVGGYYSFMKEKTGAEALFLQGAIGGWVQPEGAKKSYEEAEMRGRELAEVAVASLEKASPLSGSQVSFRNKIISFPVNNEAWKQLSAIGTINRSIQDSVITEISWFSIGDAQFGTHPGETAPFYGLETKRMMNTGPKFVLGMANDALGYILKPEFFETDSFPHSEYLTSMSLGKTTGPTLMKELEGIITKGE